MATYNVLEAKTQLSKLLDAVESGEDVVIARNGKPAARLVSVEPKRPAIRLGLAKGRLVIPEDFDELDAEVLKGMDEAEAEWRELE